MKVQIFQNKECLGKKAAELCEFHIKRAICEKGSARIVLSTGVSQLETIRNLKNVDVDWSRVEMFHLDEYIGLPESHAASFRRYLKEEFIKYVNLKKAHLVEVEGNVEAKLKELSIRFVERPVDLALIGIGENAHIAFNDPPADFETQKPFIIVKLSDTCKRQQVREGWFDSLEDVPEFAATMSVHGIMQSKVILSCVPYQVKAEAVKKTIENDITNMVPATKLKAHPDWHLYLDIDSASLLSASVKSELIL